MTTGRCGALSACKLGLNEWHQRFGHVSADKIKEMARNGSVDGLDLSDSGSMPFCEGCVFGENDPAAIPRGREGGLRDRGRRSMLTCVDPFRSSHWVDQSMPWSSSVNQHASKERSS